MLDFQFSQSDSTYKSKEYLAHFSKVEERFFVNLMEAGKTLYTIHELEQTGHSTFILRQVSDNIDEKFFDSKELEAFVKEHAGHSFFYEKEESSYQRVN